MEIKLANGKGVALIDDEDAARIPLTGWYRHPQGRAAAELRKRYFTHSPECD